MPDGSFVFTSNVDGHFEVGAGRSIPTVRYFGEAINGSLIRINRRESEVSRAGDIGIPLGGLEALRLIAQGLNP